MTRRKTPPRQPAREGGVMQHALTLPIMIPAWTDERGRYHAEVMAWWPRCTVCGVQVTPSGWARQTSDAPWVRDAGCREVA